MAEGTESVSDESYEEDSINLKGAVEDRLLRVNARLDDGTVGKVFSVLPTEQGPQWRCHPCKLTVVGSRKIYQHERSKQHADTMVQPQPHSVSRFRPQSPPTKPRQTVLEMSLAPGEPVPPGFEGEVRGITDIQTKLDNFKTTPLIGLEYLVELHDYDDAKEPQYICILCDKRGDPRTVMAHLVSLNHRRKFLENHFPKVMQKVNKFQFINNKDFKKACQIIVTKIAEWIEKRFGRLAPHACDKESFERKRESYTQTIVRDVHFSDRGGETFLEFVDENLFVAPDEQVKKPVNEEVPGCKPPLKVKRRSPSPPIVNAPAGFKKRHNIRVPDRRSLSPISSASSSSLSDTSSVEATPAAKPARKSSSSNHPKFHERSRSGSSRVYSKPYRYRSRSRSPRGRYTGSKMPWARPEYSYNRRRESESSNRTKISTEAARWDEYKRGVSQIESELEHSLRNHEKNPEKHPQYPEEWKKFWNRRYKELQAEHKDPSKHDFKPEWIDFWNKRMKEMHDIELKMKKDSLRKRLNLPEEPQPIKFKIMPKKNMNSNIKRDDGVHTDPNIIVIDDSKDEDTKSVKSGSSGKRDRKRSHSPWESDFQHEPERFIVKRDYYGSSRLYVERSKYAPHPIPKYQPEEPEDDTQLNIIAVLRLLTALEEKLGSLGPKIIDMLSSALAMEKTEANSAETLLDNDVNCVLFETVKEKLKGQLLAGMIELNAEKPAKNAVKKIASLLHVASERKREQQAEQDKLGVKTKPVTVPGVGDVDKEAIAKQIAAALVAQGRTDVTQAELEQLINAVVGMSQQSQTTNNPITTAEYAAQLQSTEPVSNKVTTPPITAAPTALQMLQSTYANDMSTNAMDGLSDSDLKTLLQNFKDLSTDEQHGLISYLKKLEAREPERVERLRKFVNLGPSKTEADSLDLPEKESPFNKKSATVFGEDEIIFEEIDEIKPADEENTEPVKIDSDDDDDYTFEDVFNAASKNLKEKQLAEERKLIEETMKKKDTVVDPNVVLKDAKMMIANIMGQLGQKNATATGNLLGFDSRDKSRSTPTTTMLHRDDRLGGVDSERVSQSTNPSGSGSAAFTGRNALGNPAYKPNTMPVEQYGEVPAAASFEYNSGNVMNEHYTDHAMNMYQQFPPSQTGPNSRSNFQQQNYQQGGSYAQGDNYSNGNFDGSGGQHYQQPYGNYGAPNPYNQTVPQGYGNVNPAYTEDVSAQNHFNSTQSGYSNLQNRSGFNNRGYY